MNDKIKNIFGRRQDKIFIVAEISANHGQDYSRAVAMIRKAKQCGADAVKFQTYTPETLTVDADNRYFRIKHPQWGGQTLFQLYQQAYTPWAWFKKLKKVADSEGIIFFSAAFDKSAVDLLEDIHVPCHKIASFELVDIPLIEYAAKTGKPLILSTGMATFDEITEAVAAARKAGAKDLILLKCVSNYPAKPRDMNLKTILHMRKKFNCPIGISDHTLGIGVSVSAVALGARVIEKHFTLSRSIKTPDGFFSIEPSELKQLVVDARMAAEALGDVSYGLTNEERKGRKYRRSLFTVKDISKGDVFTEENVRSVRPGFGMKPKYLSRVLGKKATANIKKGTPLMQKFVRGLL